VCGLAWVDQAGGEGGAAVLIVRGGDESPRLDAVIQEEEEGQACHPLIFIQHAIVHKLINTDLLKSRVAKR
jgi:hypothetical protein